MPSPASSLIQFAQAVRAISSTGLDLLELGIDTARPLLEGFDRIDSWYGATRPEFRRAVRSLPFVFHTPLPDGSCHATDFYARQLGAPDGLVPRLAVPRKPANFIACHPFSGSPRKNWPIERFLELRRSLPVRYCIGPEEALEGAVYFPDLGILARWLATANAYLGNDSGITHLAGAIGLPVVALFGPTDPQVWAPRGPNVRVLQQQDLSAYTLIYALIDAADGLDLNRRTE